MNVLAQVLWQSPVLAPVAIALAAIAAAAVLWLYPSQTIGVPRGWRWVMPGLRASAAGALAIAVMQPIVLRPRTISSEGALLLLVDRSRSMSIIDADRSPAELVALAAGLGQLPPDARREAAPGLSAQIELARTLSDQLTRARSEADYAALSGRGQAAAEARVRDAAERLRSLLAAISAPPTTQPTDLTQRLDVLRQVPPNVDQPDSLRRIRANVDAAAAAVSRAQSQADAQLFRRSPEVRAICRRLGNLSREDLVKSALAFGPQSLLTNLAASAPLFAFTFADDLQPLVSSASTRIDLDAWGTRTNLAGALRSSMQRIGSRPVAAIILLTDGRQVGGESEGLLSDVASAGVPIFAINAAATGERPDVAVTSLAAPPAARLGQVIHARADLRAPGFRTSSIDVRLDAGNVRQVQNVTFNDDGFASADFDVTITDPGPQVLVASAFPLAGEATEENNRAQHWLRVGRQPVRVTVIAGRTSARQYASLHEALSRAPWITLREFDADNAASLTPRSILQQDVVILSDAAVDDLTDQQWGAIDQLASQRGGSVIVCAGANAPVPYARSAAAKLLPFDPASLPRPAWRSWPGGEPHFALAAPSSSADSSDAPDAWQQLAPIARFVPAPPLGASARALLVERDTGAAIVSEARHGAGKVYFIGTDQTWRWRGSPDGGEREQFWPRMMRLAAGEPFAVVNESLAIDVDNLAPEPGETINVRARALDAFGDPADANSLTLHILRGGQSVRDLTLSPTSAAGRYEASITNLPAGEYLLRLDPPPDPSAEVPPDPVELPLRVEPRYTAELSNVSADDQLLRRIASASGGQFLTLDQLDTLPPRLAAIRQRQSRFVEYALWDSPHLFIFVVACLSAEWALRKKFGLA